MDRRVARWILCFAIAGFGSFPALGQDGQPEAGGEAEAPKAPARERRQGMTPGGRPMGVVARLYPQLPGELGLDDAQKAKLEEMMTQYRATLRDWTGPDGQDMREEMKTIREEMRAARQAQDDQRVQELMEQMRTISESRRTAATQAMEQLDVSIKEMLTPEQVTKYEKLRETEMSRMQTARQPMADPNTLRRAVMSLELGEEQRGRIIDLFKQYAEPSSEQKDAPPPDRQDSLRRLNDEVRKELTKEQIDQLEERLEKQRGAHNARGDRRGRRPGSEGHEQRPEGDSAPGQPGDHEGGAASGTEGAAPQSPDEPAPAEQPQEEGGGKSR